jgi:hypothetical protein
MTGIVGMVAKTAVSHYFGGAGSRWGTHASTDSGFDQGKLELQVNPQSPLRQDPEMWKDLLAALRQLSQDTFNNHRNHTARAISQAMQTNNQALQNTNNAVKVATDAVAQIQHEILVTDELYSNILRRLRYDLRFDRERFGELRDRRR